MEEEEDEVELQKQKAKNKIQEILVKRGGIWLVRRNPQTCGAGAHILTSREWWMENQSMREPVRGNPVRTFWAWAASFFFSILHFYFK